MTQQSFGTPSSEISIPPLVFLFLLRTGHPFRKMALIAIYSFCLDGDWCYPTMAKIAFRVECSEREIRRAVAWLAANGFVEARVRPGRTTLYRVPTPDCQSGPPRTDSPPKETVKRTAIRYTSDRDRLQARLRAYVRAQERRRG